MRCFFGLASPIAGLLALGSMVWADSVRAAEGKITYGAGMVSCAEWQQSRSKDNKSAELQLQAWLDGFFSAYNLVSDEPDFLAPKPQSVAYYAWIDNYCAQNPLNPVVQAAFALQKELVSRARR
ncbi:hypothetical protein [Bradyrhizobium sp. CCBAU 53415]|uniref:hypothetical protein n=1 Tax=Bradyrhizobium sp. CCBAU 53415 TaxID=1325119 RepID=UPI002306B521|nr:hypothetical protein [Bradyrhizobium sp. CCBAU 53415]